MHPSKKKAENNVVRKRYDKKALIKVDNPLSKGQKGVVSAYPKWRSGDFTYVTKNDDLVKFFKKRSSEHKHKPLTDLH